MPRKKKAEPKKIASAKPAEKPKRGRPEGTGFKPTVEQRELVKAMAGYGIPEDEMVKLIISPTSKRPIAKHTLLKHFRDELDQGFVSAKQRIIGSLFKNAVDHNNVTAQIFLAKVRCGYQERTTVEAPVAEPSRPEENSMLEGARRIAFVLAQGAHIVGVGQKNKKA